MIKVLITDKLAQEGIDLINAADGDVLWKVVVQRETDWTRPAESRGFTFFQRTGETSYP